MSNELKTQEEKSLASKSTSFNLDNFMEGGVDKKDVSIYKALLCQQMSSAKRENTDLKDGDLFLSNTNKDIIITQGETVEFMPLIVEKLLQVFENKSGGLTYATASRGKWLRTEAVGPHNKDMPEYTKEEINNRLMACYSHFISKNVKGLAPTRLDFKGGSKKAFEVILEKVIEHGESGEASDPTLPQMDLVFELKVVQKTNADNQVFSVLLPKFSRMATNDEKAEAFKKLMMVKTLSETDKYNDSDLKD